MANIRYNVDCPSCEASVLITSSSKIGKKTDCPKCKYRFTVPEPPNEDGDDAPKVKTKKKGDKKKGGNATLIYVGIAALALILLGVVGFVIFGGEPTPSGQAGTTPNNAASSGDASAKITTGAAPVGSPSSAAGADGPTAGDTPAPMGDTPAADDGMPKAASIVGTGGKLKDVTNLLPGETTAVYRVNFERLNTNCTPLATSLLDVKIRDLFRNSMTFGTDQLAVYIHCIVGPDRDAFGVIRTKEPVNESALYADLQLEEVENGVRRGRKFFRLKNNAFVDAVSLAFTTQTITKLIGIDNWPQPTQKELDEKAKKKYGFCAYDRQTLIIADLAILERYLEDMQDNGYPPFKTEMTSDAAAPAATPTPMGGEGGEGGPPPGFKPPMPMGPMGPGRGMSNNFLMQVPGEVRPLPRPDSPGAPGAPGAPGGPPAGNAPPSTRRLFTSIPTYRTIDPPLKKLLNQLEEDDSTTGPAIVYAERIDQRIFNGRAYLQNYAQTGSAVAALISRVQMIGATFSMLTKDKLNAKVAMEFVSDDDAKKTAAEIIEPNLKIFAPVIDIFMGSQTTVTSAAPAAGGGGGGFPGGSGDGPPGGFQPPNSSGQPPARGSVGGGSQPPGSFPGGDNQGPAAAPNALFASTMNIDVSDRILVIDIAMKWQEDKFNTYLQPQIARISGMLKGRMSVLTGEIEWHRLAAVSNKLQTNKKIYPRGTLEREASDARYRLPYPPEHRVSFFVDLLPYIGQGPLRSQIQDKKLPWYAKENLGPAEAWIPEFLVPYYPQETWRASNGLAPGRQLGATNYVAPAGLGLDAGRYDPTNPDQAKKVGITGYGWGSKFEDVKDGTSNTIYLIQAAPGVARPWIVGGGSTLVGINDGPGDPMAPFNHRTKDGTRGTYVLMADGSVRFLKEGTDPAVFRAMVTRAGGEAIPDLDKAGKKIAPTKPLESDLRGGPVAGGKKDDKTPAIAVNDEDLKPFQGTWKATFVKLPELAKNVPAAVRDQLKYEVKFDGNIVRIRILAAGKEIESPGFEIVRLDPKANPKVLDIKNDKGKIEPGIYEMTGNRLKIRSSEKGRPTKVAIPDEKSEDSYLELEKVE